CAGSLAAADGAVRQAGRGTDGGDPAPAQRDGFHGCPAPPAALGQLLREAVVLRLDPSHDSLVHHAENRDKFPTWKSTPISSDKLRAAPKKITVSGGNARRVRIEFRLRDGVACNSLTRPPPGRAAGRRRPGRPDRRRACSGASGRSPCTRTSAGR